MSEVVNIPQLRFPEFETDWEKEKLKNVSTYFNGGSFENDVQVEGRYELVTLKSINMSGSLVHSKRFIEIEVSTLSKNTLVMILSEQSPGLLGMTALIPIDNKYVLNQRVAEIRPNDNVDSYFLSMSINRNQRYFGKHGAGTKVQNLSKPNVENYEFLCPTKPEQQKIAAFLTAVDNKIEQLSKKQELLGEYKKGLMQQIFSQAIRFKANDDSEFPDWEEKKLGDVCKLQGGYAFKSAEFQKHGIPIIRISNISNNNDFIDNRNLVYYNEIKNSDKFIIKNGDLIVAMSGATTGKSSIYNLIEDAYLNQRVGLFKANNSLLDYGFLIQIVFSYIFATQLDSVLVAGAQPNVSSKDIEGFEISLPSKIEQNKIANFLSSIDSKIEQVGKQLDESKQFKKALLQQMFV
jgi:type I restriction enzyme S subunit